MNQRRRPLSSFYETSTGCWEWKSCRTRYGYGYRSVDGVKRAAHRLVYTELKGPIPPGLDLDHLCRNRGCVNPDHLEPVTRRENLLRGVGVTAENAAKTSCKNGHELNEKNTYLRHDFPWRHCRVCDAERHRGYRKADHASV